MGNFSSQYVDEWQAVQKQETAVSKDNAEMTPKSQKIRCLPVDPRSPGTSAIRRTPIQVEKTPQNKSYTDVADSDENTLDFHDCEEACESTALQEPNVVPKVTDVKTARNCLPGKRRSPLKNIARTKTDSPTMYLRYKQFKEIREKCSRESLEKTIALNYEPRNN